jgi:4-phospho-D-threonate 3-dehydrogenase / 4-phospho-D-erythronate 3-dehydrogenase
MGDGAGIGPEVVLKAIVSPRLTDRCLPLIIGDPRIILSLLSSLRIDIPLKVYRDINHINWSKKEIRLLEVEGAPEKLPIPGKIDAGWARTAMNSVALGVELSGKGEVSALVTGPINKEGIHRAGYKFQGHTDYLAYLTGTENYAMMLIGGDIRVVLATVHIPLNEVSSSLNKEEIVKKIYLARDAMLRFGIRTPRIAVAGLNPHAGEGGAFGREDLDIISPAVEECRGEGLLVQGPLPPDTLFYKVLHSEYDVAVVMYHDQGLIPLKMLAFDRGVNITLGLPFVRTSPDHGTAYDIAGQGTANPDSMIEAINTACLLTSMRSNSK